jgi:hypothetical protein
MSAPIFHVFWRAASQSARQICWLMMMVAPFEVNTTLKTRQSGRQIHEKSERNPRCAIRAQETRSARSLESL